MIIGYKREEVVGKTTLEIDLWNDPKEREDYIAAFKKETTVDGAIYTFKTKAGALIMAQIYSSTVIIDKEEYLLAVVDDITEKQAYMQQLEQKKKELETIIEEAPNPIILHNEEGKVLMVNKVWKELTGYSDEEIDTIDKWMDKAYGLKMPLIKKVIEKLYTIEHKVDDGEFSIRTKNDASIVWQFSSAPLGIIDGKRTVISTAMDITELKKKDEVMMVQSRYAAMGEMIGMIAHQWRQPVSGIAMDANNMLLDIALGDFSAEAAEAYGKEILEQTEHLSKTIDDFRNYIKPEQAIAKVNLQQVLEDTYAIVKESLANHSIAFTTTYSSESEVNAYPRELMQVFVNIINNAKDALIAKNVQDARIEVRVINDGEYVTTEICDNGGGIDASIIDKVFDPYFTTKDEKTGTGIGLYMSKMIIEEHLHGILEVSNSDAGACFRVRLLKNRKDDLTEPSASSSEQL
jgi:PAS domain S-box-containing protein